MASDRRATSSLVISAGLVTIPAKVYSSYKPNESNTSRNQLHTKCNGRINQKKVCNACNVDLESADIVKGYEYEKGKYVMFSDEEYKQLSEGANGTFEVTGFVDTIPNTYFEKSYDLGADKGGEKHLPVFIAALAESGKMAIGNVSLRDKTQLACLRIVDGVLMLTTLYHESEINAPFGQPLPTGIDNKLLALFGQLISSMETTFNPSEMVDTFYEKFMDVVNAKIRDPNASVVAPATKSAVLDLAAALQASIERSAKAPVAKAVKKPKVVAVNTRR